MGRSRQEWQVLGSGEDWDGVEPGLLGVAAPSSVCHQAGRQAQYGQILNCFSPQEKSEV